MMPSRTHSSRPKGSCTVASRSRPVRLPLSRLLFSDQNVGLFSPAPALSTQLNANDGLVGRGLLGREDNSAFADHGWIEGDCI